MANTSASGRSPCEVEAVYTDCFGTVQRAHVRGKATSSANPRAHLWTSYWATLGPSTFVHKTKTHTTMAQVHEGVTMLWEHHSNAAADARAKQGAALHPWSGDCDERLNEE